MQRWLIILLLALYWPASYARETVNIYTWSNYIPQNVINKFEKITGIHVNINEFDDNATLYAKLKADPHIGYDIIVPSSYYVYRMRKQDMLHKIDHHKTPNIKYFNPALMHLKFDPHNNYSLPFTWGSTGILVDKRYWNIHSIHKWQDLWQPRFRNQLLILNDPREAFAMALLTLGYSINDHNPKHIQQAYKKLQQLLPNIKVFNTNAIINIYTDQDASIGMSWNGEANIASRGNPNLVYIYPQNGFSIWLDCLAIPKYAPHLKNAYRFINFLEQPKIASLIAIADGYSTPNLAALKYLPKSYRDNPMINPNQKTLQRGHIQLYIGKARKLYQHDWERLKLGG